MAHKHKLGKKVISFSLYGRHPKYSRGAIANARHASRAYPGWVCRFYVADDVQEITVSRLQAAGAEVIKMGPRLLHESMNWRFFAAVDPEVDIAIIRDTDSRFTKSELLMVNEWLASGKKFHVMRYNDLAHYPIMGGLWGVRGAIPEVKALLENQLRSAKLITKKWGADQRFLLSNLYPLMKRDVFIHEMYSMYSPEKRKYHAGETIHKYPPTAYSATERGRYLEVGPGIPSHRGFIVFSIYKRTIFSEFLLTFWLGIIEKLKLFTRMKARFYVADNISPGLIERLRRHGQVIIMSTKIAHNDDPQYWKLLILAEKNLDVAMIVDFWQLFFLVRAIQGRIRLYEVPPIEDGIPTGWLTKFATLSVCGPAPPISDIKDLITRRAPNQNYREFIRSTVYPRTSTTRIMSVLGSRGSVGFLYVLTRILLPVRFYDSAGRVKKYLKVRIKR